MAGQFQKILAFFLVFLCLASGQAISGTISSSRDDSTSLTITNRANFPISVVGWISDKRGKILATMGAFDVNVPPNSRSQGSVYNVYSSDEHYNTDRFYLRLEYCPAEDRFCSGATGAPHEIISISRGRNANWTFKGNIPDWNERWAMK